MVSHRLSGDGCLPSPLAMAAAILRMRVGGHRPTCMCKMVAVGHRTCASAAVGHPCSLTQSVAAGLGLPSRRQGIHRPTDRLQDTAAVFYGAPPTVSCYYRNCICQTSRNDLVGEDSSPQALSSAYIGMIHWLLDKSNMGCINVIYELKFLHEKDKDSYHGYILSSKKEGLRSENDNGSAMEPYK